MFLFIIIIVVIQRLVELLIANRNAKWMKAQGGIEIGASHYKYIVFLHISFFISLLIEGLRTTSEMTSWWWIPFILFVIAQIGRVWSLSSLGKYWNTRIIILPGAKVVAKGPYRFMRHPNYVIVATEIIVLPIMFQAYVTAIVFTILNAIILSIRIREEENGLRSLTDYEKVFENRFRFIPFLRGLRR
ncbi:isoprenylcysteine carboxyl methyltransferase family protein [Bacillus alkalicellulosilyticus]|uniref:isoprenylcysteine carboxyl methyltransferase family protein n=1 Tax=Alkalihalobacterium alkalicellulosilyticum TaxID=1912214 RepID=UPI0009963388|nr:isoprenylcysteine carboxylmethyltransferase family protein [Bacillus alkalicellulosilyticus]